MDVVLTPHVTDIDGEIITEWVEEEIYEDRIDSTTMKCYYPGLIRSRANRNYTNQGTQIWSHTVIDKWHDDITNATDSWVDETRHRGRNREGGLSRYERIHRQRLKLRNIEGSVNESLEKNLALNEINYGDDGRVDLLGNIPLEATRRKTKIINHTIVNDHINTHIANFRIGTVQTEAGAEVTNTLAVYGDINTTNVGDVNIGTVEVFGRARGKHINNRIYVDGTVTSNQDDISYGDVIFHDGGNISVYTNVRSRSIDRRNNSKDVSIGSVRSSSGGYTLSGSANLNVEHSGDIR